MPMRRTSPECCQIPMSEPNCCYRTVPKLCETLGPFQLYPGNTFPTALNVVSHRKEDFMIGRNIFAICDLLNPISREFWSQSQLSAISKFQQGGTP